MKLFRRRLFGALVFGLLSLGQAYPFSAAWAAQGVQRTCCCAAMKDGESGCRCRHGGKMKCHKETSPGYSATPCGAPTDVQSLNFSGEPCLLRFSSFSFVPKTSMIPIADNLFRPKFSAMPEGPPPRALFAS